MSYAIGYVIYGIPFTESISKFYEELELDPEEHFNFVYSGSAHIIPGWCGVLLDTIDECNNICIKNVKLQPLEQDVQEAKSKINKLPDEIKKMSNPIDMYIIWGTS